METIATLITFLLFLLFLSTSVYMIVRNPKKKTIVYFSLALLCGSIYVFTIILRTYVQSISYIAIDKFYFIPAELGILFWFLTSISIREDFGDKPKFQKKIALFIIILNLVTCYLHVFTNTITQYNKILEFENFSKFDGSKYVTNWYYLRILINLIKLSLPIYNFIHLLKIKKITKNKHNQKSLVLLLVSGILLFIGTMWGAVWYMFDPFKMSFSDIGTLIQNVAMFPGILIVHYVLVTYDTILEQKSEIKRELIIKFILNSAIALVFVGTIFAAYNYLEEELFRPFIVSSIFALVIISQEGRELVLQSIIDSIRRKRLTISSILISDLNFTLKHFSSPDQLAKSKLINLNSVRKLAKKEGITYDQALKQVIRSGIEALKPKMIKPKRSPNWLKYEILKMIAYEDASETQIMWDLGFDVFTRSYEEKGDHSKEPRYPYTGPSDYSATSIRSYRRLKTDAIEMLRWRLERGE